jgi:uncharacterized protein (TIGR03066 family)
MILRSLVATFGLLAVITLTAAAVAAPQQKADDAKPNKDVIVGTWELVKTTQGDLGGVVLRLEFTKDGKMIMRNVKVEKTSVMYEAKYKVTGDKGDKLDYESVTEGVDKKETLKIVKLTEKELVFEDDDKVVEEFKRVKEDKKEKK